MSKTQVPMENIDSLANALGVFLSQWAVLENILSLLLGSLISVNQQATQIIFRSSFSLRSKLEMMERLTYISSIDEKQKEEITYCLGEVAKLNKRRNLYVHATWAAGKTDETLTLIPGSLHGNTKKIWKEFGEIASKDIEKDTDEIRAIYNRLVDQLAPSK